MSGVTAEQVLAMFEAAGLRQTRPRRLIAERLAALAHDGADFTTDELWHTLLEMDPQLGRATVFRTVEVLAEQGLLNRVSFADGSHRYRICETHRHHHHMTCTNCRRVVDIPFCVPIELLAAIERETDFAVEGHALELFGRCPACREQEHTVTASATSPTPPAR